MNSALDQFYHPNLILFLFVQDLKSELDIRSAQCSKQTDLIAQLEDHVEQLQTISTPYRYSVHTISIPYRQCTDNQYRSTGSVHTISTPYRQCTNNQYTVQVVYRQSVLRTGSVHTIRTPYIQCTNNQYTVQVVYRQSVLSTGGEQKSVHSTDSVQTISTL